MSKYNIRCEKYNDTYIVVKGSDTIKFKDTLSAQIGAQIIEKTLLSKA